MKTVVIPDIHNRTYFADKVMKTESADRYVFLGDYFDSFYDHPAMALCTATWLKTILDRDDCVCLWGNHDVPYQWFTNWYVQCPGFSHEKNRAIRSILATKDFEKLKWYHEEQGFVLSHAGLHPTIFCQPLYGFSFGYVDQVIRLGIEKLNAGFEPAHCISGHRMGRLHFGGCTWADWDDEFEPILGVNQIVGHTPGETARVKLLLYPEDSVKNMVEKFLTDDEKLNADSVNYCIDCECYGIIENGKFNVKYITK